MTATIFHAWMPSPLGRLLLVGGGERLLRINLCDSDAPEDPPAGSVQDERSFEDAVAQLREYFDGRRRRFDLALAPEGTPFQREVWEALQRIPYGATASYRQLAETIGRPAAVRAVGAANGRNPLPIVIPCHRVIGSDGTLTGYRGGVRFKESLLGIERGEGRREN